ncbi:MAG: sulfide/dihydroorotate dehydrogenase-like FAD/NAD-binding protein [Sarcina ventriculi]|uniref:Sulfide/dihydroorotate dehydrogenase-like FAD/NAD-binding protein n=1 Tax=Candidatus Sarcina troglodytae TaxID=2726954 RepID=A0ACD1BFA3_9CLOT|nr:sulfide/dihydroorotate dehydrogenase-like FAD/NAD-binding protein [Sarcina sp. JB2]MCI5637224.1 sulfide/dihydroorotate dehydrogenase-like FAD/NAD-binding protein [Sarcina ventriculi]MDY7061402.1 sulfide/dihydroorotate dehydrogenase-like FAD/NAD-binding protein [Sarcina ventriculi]QPJ86089.1 sulfide/dihydroorotate dehydrogenase-like FAD/NAD-binding protein [Sarcina sp. JB2]
MYEIVEKKQLAESIYFMNIKAPRVAKAAKPGQFIIAKIDEKGERIPLTICNYDKDKKIITIVFQVVGESTRRMSLLNKGDYFRDFVGPLGVESQFVNEDISCLKNKRILFVAGGVGVAPIYPQVKWLNSKGIKADVIIGAKNKDMLIFENEIKNEVGNLYITTDDGSYGMKGLVTDKINDLVNIKNKEYDLVVAIGPMVMMKFVARLTKKLNIPTVVSLNPIMLDGTGMCGACRVTVGGKVKFACVDGPEFDAHKIDFDEAMKRQSIYKTEEGKKYLKNIEGKTHSGGCGMCGGDK